MATARAMPKLPVRAAIYLLADGSVQFGALFEELLPVARALQGTPAAAAFLAQGAAEDAQGGTAVRDVPEPAGGGPLAERGAPRSVPE